MMHRGFLAGTLTPIPSAAETLGLVTVLVRIVGAWVMCSMTVAIASAEVPREIVEQAIAAYRGGLEATSPDERRDRFAQSSALFWKVIETCPERVTAELLVNLGNAALQAHQHADAIWAFRSALERDPGHAQARTNLQFARSQLPEWVQAEQPPNVWDLIFVWTRSHRRSTLHFAASVLFLVASLLTAWKILHWERIPTWLAISGWATWTLLVTLLAGWSTHGTESAVIIREDVVGRTADSEAAPAQFAETLPAGTEVEVLEERGEWCRVRLANQAVCWLFASSLRRIGNLEHKSVSQAQPRSVL